MLTLSLLISCACRPDQRPATADAETCEAGATRCSGVSYERCSSGHFELDEVCSSACSPTIGCTECVAGVGSCEASTSHVCNGDGSGYVDEVCDFEHGIACNADNGRCEGACSLSSLGHSYVGCDYYAVIIGNSVYREFDFAIAVANTSSAPATVTIGGGRLTAPIQLQVAVGSVAVQSLPWDFELKLCDAPDDNCPIPESAAFVPRGAYHVVATEPVVVHQFSPLQSRMGDIYSITNDASLLLPSNAWSTSYVVASFDPFTYDSVPSEHFGSEFAVSAREDNTDVTITTTADTVASHGVPAFLAGIAQTLTLNAGDVLELSSLTGDLTGTAVASDGPVQVIGGHYGAQVPVGVVAADHLEESMFPIDTLGKHYLINAPAIVSAFPDGKEEVVRIIATQPDTTLTFQPPQSAIPTSITSAGEFIQFASVSSLEVVSDKPVMIAQYMEGEGAGGGTGDPAMTLAVPVEQFRRSYLFLAPTTYESNYVDVTAPIGTTVMFDGLPFALSPIAGTGFGIVRIEGISDGANDNGVHFVESDQPAGLSVYGYGPYTSYWYPGGLDLLPLIQ
jgi:IgGFc binding protein